MLNWNILGEYDEKKDVVETILANRGIKNVNEFLSTPSLNKCFEQMPVDFKDSLKKAVRLIKAAMVKKTPIVIFGDYDSDGINATAILYNFFKNEKVYEKVSYFIPNRFEHDYGISKAAVDDALKKFKKDKTGEAEKILFITVDVGITACKEIKYIKKLGHEVVLTDHHQKPDKIPQADCIVWTDRLCGAGISWILSKALGSKNTESIAMAALATVTDLQTLTGFNRVIVKKGLEILNSRPPLGLQKLLEVSGKTPAEITTYELGWLLGPRLNASGRLETAEDSIRLLVEKDEKTLEKLAESLNTKNIQRQEKTLEMYKLALPAFGGDALPWITSTLCKSTCKMSTFKEFASFSEFDAKHLPKILFTADAKYHEGVIGLVAAKLVQQYYRPAIVVCLMDEYGKGSARSIAGVNIIEMLHKFEDLFIDLGGHPMAAGFTIDKKNLSKFKKKLLDYADEKIKDELLVPTLNIDLKIPINVINHELLEDTEKLKPFGLGNEQPVFVSEDLGVAGVDVMGKDLSHLKISLYDGKKYYKAVYFGGAKHSNGLKIGEKIDLVYTLKKNEYNGNKYIDLIVKDFRKV